MNYFLTLDIGNTNQTLALFDENQNFIKKVALTEFQALKDEFKLNSLNATACVSSVKDSKLIDLGIKTQNVKDIFKSSYFLDMPVNYGETIGQDRLVNAFYLFHKNEKRKMVIDTGSFTTIDIVSLKGFEGGYILPGLKVIQRSYEYGENLAQYSFEKLDFNFNKSLPTETKGAIEQGILLTYLSPILHLIASQKIEELYFTGGNAKQCIELLKENFLKNKLEMIYNQELIHKSLCYIAKRIYK